MITINLPGRPIPLARHRTTAVRGRLKQYDSQKKQKAAVQAMMLQQIGLKTPRLLDYDSYTVTFVFSFYKPFVDLYKDAWGFMEAYAQKPDIDNLEKFYLDCGNGLLWTDDAKVDKVIKIKTYGKTSHTEMHIMPKKTYEFSPLAEIVMKNLTPEDIHHLATYLQVLVDFDSDTCDYTAVEQAENIAATLHKIAEQFAEPLMRIKKNGGKYVN